MKYQRIEVRINDKEKAYLLELAKANGLSLSEYIRVKLLEEVQVDKSSKRKKDMTIFNVVAYYLVAKMARKQLSEEEISDAKNKSKKTLAEYNIRYE